MVAVAGLGAVAVLALSLAAKMCMTFGINIKQTNGYEGFDEAMIKWVENAKKAQANVAEYEALFIIIFLFFYIEGVDSWLVTVVSILVPLAQAIYFWGRYLSGQMMPWAPMGALPRYICMGISIYILYTIVTAGSADYGPGPAAVVTVVNSFAAKLYMSFGINVKSSTMGPQGSIQLNVSKAQLNVKEYEALFTVIFLFLFTQKVESLLVTILCIWVPIAQAIYFWGRVLSDQAMPWSPIGALSRYVCMGISIGILFTTVDKAQYGPGLGAVAILALSLAAKMYMSFAIRITNATGDKATNASKAQLNVAEYEDLFMAILLFYYQRKISGMLVMVVAIVLPIAQAIYFWGRTLSGAIMPWGPFGALPRYICMGISIFILYGAVSAE